MHVREMSTQAGNGTWKLERGSATRLGHGIDEDHDDVTVETLSTAKR